jgi:hypothetical protein
MFIIKETDTIKATVCCSKSGKLLASVYDSGFTRISQVESALMRKIPFYGRQLLCVSIVNIDKELYKTFDIKVY